MLPAIVLVRKTLTVAGEPEFTTARSLPSGERADTNGNEPAFTCVPAGWMRQPVESHLAAISQ